MLISISLSKGLADKYGKRDVYKYGLLGCLYLCLYVYFSNPIVSDDVPFANFTRIYIWYNYSYSLGSDADVADYSGWKTGRRATAIIFFSYDELVLKAGLSIGGALVASIVFYNYIPKDGSNGMEVVEQTPSPRRTRY